MRNHAVDIFDAGRNTQMRELCTAASVAGEVEAIGADSMMWQRIPQGLHHGAVHTTAKAMADDNSIWFSIELVAARYLIASCAV